MAHDVLTRNKIIYIGSSQTKIDQNIGDDIFIEHTIWWVDMLIGSFSPYTPFLFGFPPHWIYIDAHLVGHVSDRRTALLDKFRCKL